MRFRLLAEAQAEINEAREYLNGQVPELGERFLDDLELTFREIRLLPRRFPKVETLPSDEPYQRAILSVSASLSFMNVSTARS
jgi:hypothetical protein